jgi:ketosteroid isomerase-like protein
VDATDLASKVRQALDSADLSAFADLLDPGVTWGPPDDNVSGCHNRDQVIAWYGRARAEGMHGEVTEVVVGADALLVGLRVGGTAEAVEAGGVAERWQVLKLRHGKVTDIRGFPDRAEAAARAGVAS